MDDIVESLNDVGLKDRSMVWNTDLVEVSAMPFSCFCDYIQWKRTKDWFGRG